LGTDFRLAAGVQDRKDRRRRGFKVSASEGRQTDWVQSGREGLERARNFDELASLLDSDSLVLRK